MVKIIPTFTFEVIAPEAAAPEAAVVPLFIPKRHQLDRDSRLKIFTLKEVGWIYLAISKHLNVIIRQVQLACNAGHPTPFKRRGRPPLFDTPKRQDIIGFVTLNKVIKRMTLA